MPLPANDKNADLKMVNVDGLRKVMGQFSPKTQEMILAAAQEFRLNKAKKELLSKFSGSANDKWSDKLDEVSKNKSRVSRIFNDVKESLIQSVTQGRAENGLSVEQRNLVKRIQTVTLVHGDDPYALNDTNCKDNINAYYNSNSHSVILCASYYGAPGVSIVEALGHEIGHSLDPCNSSFALMNDSRTKKYYLNMDLVRNKSDIEISSGFERGQHPNYKVERCLVEKSKFLEISDKDRKINADLEARFEQSNRGLSDKEAAQIRKTYYESASKNQCGTLITHSSKLNETMADVYGAVAVEDYLKNRDLGNSNLQTLAIWANWSDLCSNGNPGVRDGHAMGRVRFERILMQVPQVAKGMGCERNKEYQCLDKSFVPSQGLKNSSPAGVR